MDTGTRRLTLSEVRAYEHITWTPALAASSRTLKTIRLVTPTRFDVDQTGALNDDDPGNNIKHIYVPGGLSVGQTYTIAVTLKSSDVPVRYGLAWQVKDYALQNNLWVEE